jgi:hypothetical protein
VDVDLAFTRMQKERGSGEETLIQCCRSGMYPGSEFSIPDPGSKKFRIPELRQWISVFFTLKPVSKLSEIIIRDVHPGYRILIIFFFIPDPGVRKAPDPDPDPQHCTHLLDFWLIPIRCEQTVFKCKQSLIKCTHNFPTPSAILTQNLKSNDLYIDEGRLR